MNSDYFTSAVRLGCPIDQTCRFISAEVMLQERQLVASAAARACDQADGPTAIGYGGARGGAALRLPGGDGRDRGGQRFLNRFGTAGARFADVFGLGGCTACASSVCHGDMSVSHMSLSNSSP